MLFESNIKISSNRNFGIVFFFIFLIICLWPLTYDGQIRIWSLIISLIFLLLGLINSKLLWPLNYIWFKFGLLLGAIVAPIVMGFVFFIVVTPISFFIRLLDKDLLKNRFEKNTKTYWIKKTKQNSSMKKQF